MWYYTFEGHGFCTLSERVPQNLAALRAFGMAAKSVYPHILFRKKSIMNVLSFLMSLHGNRGYQCRRDFFESLTLYLTADLV